MNIKHRHPPFPGQEQYEQDLRHALTACVKKLRQADARRTPPGSMR